jgi:hypothetical protein
MWSEPMYAPLRDDVREVLPVDQAIIDLVVGAAVWRVPGFEVNSIVHEVRALDRHLSVSSKVDQSKAVFVCTIMQAVSANSRLVYCFPSEFISGKKARSCCSKNRSLTSSSESFVGACMLMRE